MGNFFFYFCNLFGFTIYFLINKKTNPDSPLLMLPYLPPIVFIFLGVSKWLISSNQKTHKTLISLTLVTLTSLLFISVHSILRSPGFDITILINSIRRYYGIVIFFLGFISLNYFEGSLQKIEIATFLKITILIFGTETIIESILLNTHTISLTDLPIILSSEPLTNERFFRPYGLTGSIPSTSLFLLLLITLDQGIKKQIGWLYRSLCIIAFMLTFSVTGYLTFFFILALRVFYKKSPLLLACFSFIYMSIGYFAYVFYNYFIPDKFSQDYIVWTYFYFLNLIKDYNSSLQNPLDFLLGVIPFNSSYDVLTQDFPYVTWMAEIGFIGLFSLFYVLIKNIYHLKFFMEGKYINEIIILLVISMIHYPFFTFIPIQVFLGSLLFFSYILKTTQKSLKLHEPNH